MLKHVSAFPFFIWVYSILLYVYATFCLPIHLSVDIWVPSTSWLLWIMLPWAQLCYLYYFSHSSRYVVVFYPSFNCISLMAHDVQLFFMYISAICISSLVNVLFRSFACLVIELFVFLLLNFEGSLYILDISSLLDIWLQIFSHHL